MIFARGDFQAQDRSAVAVIGTREPSSSGRALAAAVATALARAGLTVMSGLAAGIDTAAHEAALAAGARSIAVIGTGLARSYPAENAGLQSRLHVVVSQFLPEAGPRREHFPLRNALMSALSQATVIVEAGARSGARIQARHALAQGRRLFLMGPVLAQEWARTLAEGDGVDVVETPEALVQALTRGRR